MILSRREFAKLSLATPGVVLLASSLPEYKDVVLGVTTYSYRDLDLDTTLRAMTAAGVRICEFFERHAFPAKPASESWNDYNNRMRAWVLEQPIEHFRSIGNRFKDAGITIHSLTHPFRVDDSDADIRRAYDMARALGAAYIFSSTQASLARKLSAYSEQYGIGIAMHNHSKAPELCRPEEFEQAIAVSPSIGINLDIGHFVAAGYDPLPFIEKYHARIRGMHIHPRHAH